MKSLFTTGIALILVLSPIGFFVSIPFVHAGPPANGSIQILDDIVVTASRDGSSCPATFTSYPKDFREVVCFFLGFINKLLPILVAMTMLVFFWGLAGLIRNSGDEKAVKEGKQLMLWGVVALFVLVSFAGIINLFTGDFFGQSFGIPQLPQKYD